MYYVRGGSDWQAVPTYRSTRRPSPASDLLLHPTRQSHTLRSNPSKALPYCPPSNSHPIAIAPSSDSRTPHIFVQLNPILPASSPRWPLASAAPRTHLGPRFDNRKISLMVLSDRHYRRYPSSDEHHHHHHRPDKSARFAKFLRLVRGTWIILLSEFARVIVARILHRGSGPLSRNATA